MRRILGVTLVLKASGASKRSSRIAAAELVPVATQLVPPIVPAPPAAQPAKLVGWMWNWPEVLVSAVVPWRTTTLPTVWNEPQGVIVERPSSEVAPSKRVPTKSGRLSFERV